MTDNIMYDSPTEFLHDVSAGTGECSAQSVVPTGDGDGTYRCACSCGQWEIITPDRWQGLERAREHTARLLREN